MVGTSFRLPGAMISVTRRYTGQKEDSILNEQKVQG